MKVSRYRALGTVTGATKANPCVITCAAGVDQYVQVGGSVRVDGTGWATLDGKWFVVGAKTATTLTLTGADTAAEVPAVTAGLVNMDNR